MSCSASQLDEVIFNKMADLKKLKDEHKALLKSRSYTPKSKTEILNSELYRLMAEVEYLKGSEPEIMPRCNSACYAWAQHSLEEEIKQKEDNLSNLDKWQEESSSKKNLLIEMCSNSVSENVIRKKLEDAKSKNELLHGLHRKVVRRLRRLSRRFPTLPEHSEKLNKSTRDRTGNVLKRSFYRVLKEFIVELQDRTFESDNWDENASVYIDETFSEEHLDILCKANIIQADPSTSCPSSPLTDN